MTVQPKKRTMLWVRRAHMYLGLFLMPWVLFFGLSGMLFNHPGIGEATSARPIPADVLRERTGIAPVDAPQMAREVVERLRAEGKDFRVDDSFKSYLHGSTAFATSGPGVKHLVLVDLNEGRGLLLTRPDRTAPAAPFAETIDIPAHRASALEPKVAGLLPTLGVNDAERAPRLAIAPSLWFRMIDGQGRAWNATYDLKSGSLDGRPTDAKQDMSLHDLLGDMHKTHHFPARLGPTTFWALFADLTGFTLVVWALTGFAMWWQLKRTRALGVVAVSGGLLVAALTMVTIHGELRFGNVHPNEPGGPPVRPLVAAPAMSSQP